MEISYRGALVNGNMQQTPANMPTPLEGKPCNRLSISARKILIKSNPDPLKHAYLQPNQRGGEPMAGEHQ